MTENGAAFVQGQLLNTLDSGVYRCSNLLRAVFLMCDQQMKVIDENRQSDWFCDNAFYEIGTLTDQISFIDSKTLQSEIRTVLLSFPAYDRHFELLYVLLKGVLTNLSVCVEEIEKYLANKEVYDNFIEIRYTANYYDGRNDKTKEEDTWNVQHSLSKLCPDFGSANLWSNATRLINAIKSIIPASDLPKVLPANELPTSTVHELEPGVKDPDLNVKILLAYQSGILNGTFHTLLPEKQYSVLSLLFGKSRANVKIGITALYGDANTEKNPKNLPSVVEKTNDLITEKDLGIALVIGRQDK